MIGQTISHYKILEELGAGGMGVVYKAEDTRLDRPVALKFLPPALATREDVKKRFIHEAKAASSLDHPNICTIYEIDETPEGQMFIAMPHYEGETLQGKIGKGPVEVGEAIDIVFQLASGLAKAHEEGIVHRDIKPGNILITKDGQVKIVDFGLAKLATQTRLTKSGTTVGTVAYMSPEQASGSDVDARSDIFSLGVVLYELLTGELPFKGDHEAAIIYGIMHNDPKRLSEYRRNLPDSLQSIVDRLLKKEANERYQSAGELEDDLDSLVEELGLLVAARRRQGRAGAARRGFGGKRWAGVAAALVLVVAILFLVFRPFTSRVSPDQAALADENYIAVMYFENLVDRDDPGRFGEIATNLLITDLSESEYMRVISSQRLYDILKLKGKEGVKVIDRDTATEVATHAGASRMLLGSILQIEPNYLLTAQLVDVRTGEVQASQRITGEPGEKIFSLIDELASEVKSDLALPAQAGDEPEISVADVTTHSTEAYRHYVEGLEYFYKFYSDEAKASFEKAVEYDSTFALAYLRLADFRHFVAGTWQDKQAALAHARRFSDRLTKHERLYLESLEAYYAYDDVKAIKGFEMIVEADSSEKKQAYQYLGWLYARGCVLEKAIETSLKVLETNPLDKTRYNTLAYQYMMLGDGDVEKAMWAMDEYIKLTPEEANPYDTRGDIYVMAGMINEAMASYKTALEKRWDFSGSLFHLGMFYAYEGETSKAEACFRKHMDRSDASGHSWIWDLLARIPLYQGDIHAALEVLGQGLAADQIQHYEGPHFRAKIGLRGQIYVEMENFEGALSEADRALEAYQNEHPEDPFRGASFYARLAAECGEVTKAEEALKLMKDHMGATPARRLSYIRTNAWVQLHKGNVEFAVRAFEDNVDEADQCLGIYDRPRFHADLAFAFLRQERFADAANEFEWILRRGLLPLVYDPLNLVKAYYYLGSCYDQMGEREKAIANFERFLDYWHDADPAFEEVPDAKRRLAALKGM
jgi:tetratricopeptide (TPR) repeat protein